ncbi:MAG: preprotein translocase subunit SecG [Alphaproteobacteria bacterium]|nr:preprotein translocase subunit SecG [Alphaproteobacteria bacterium]
METVLLVVYLLVAIFLVAVILMQRSSGGALNGLGGGDGTSSIFSARGTGNFLTRLTAILATVFFLAAIALSLLYKSATPRQVSILETPAQSAPVQPVESDTPSAPSAPIAGE